MPILFSFQSTRALVVFGDHSQQNVTGQEYVPALTVAVARPAPPRASACAADTAPVGARPAESAVAGAAGASSPAAGALYQAVDPEAPNYLDPRMLVRGGDAPARTPASHTRNSCWTAGRHRRVARAHALLCGGLPCFMFRLAPQPATSPTNAAVFGAAGRR